MISRIIIWLAGTVPVSRWLVCLGALCLFVDLVVLALIVFLNIESTLYDRKDTDEHD